MFFFMAALRSMKFRHVPTVSVEDPLVTPSQRTILLQPFGGLATGQ